MKRIDLIIPTRNRWEKLQRCLNSIPKNIPNIELNIIIICDGDLTTAQMLLETNDEQIGRVVYVRDHSGSVYCRNLMTQCAEDAVIYATDDIEFLPGAIEAAVKAMAEHFPDGDGIIGFNQGSHQEFSAAGVALLGQKFLQRYPQRKLFFPEYFHFSCQEIERLGNRLDKLHLEKDAELIHYHPSYNHDEADKTHEEARVKRQADRDLSISRRKDKKIWGAE
jgi:glycosyltransferase involved in cell wall biosynthesis